MLRPPTSLGGGNFPSLLLKMQKTEAASLTDWVAYHKAGQAVVALHAGLPVTNLYPLSVTEARIRFCMAGAIAEYRYAPGEVCLENSRNDLNGAVGEMQRLMRLELRPARVEARIALLYREVDELITQRWDQVAASARAAGAEHVSGDELNEVVRGNSFRVGRQSRASARR